MRLVGRPPLFAGDEEVAADQRQHQLVRGVVEERPRKERLLQPLEEVRLGGVVGPQPGASPLILFEARRRSDAQAEDFSSIPAISPAPRTGVPPEPVPVAGSKSASARSMNRPTAAARLEGSGAMWTVPSRSS